jgi:hypothetical protein
MFHAKSTLHRAVRMELIPDARFYWDLCNFVPSVHISFPAIFFPPYSVPRVQIDGTQRPFCTAPITRYDHIKLFGLALSRAPPANERAPCGHRPPVWFILFSTTHWHGSIYFLHFYPTTGSRVNPVQLFPYLILQNAVHWGLPFCTPTVPMRTTPTLLVLYSLR